MLKLRFNQRVNRILRDVNAAIQEADTFTGDESLETMKQYVERVKKAEAAAESLVRMAMKRKPGRKQAAKIQRLVDDVTTMMHRLKAVIARFDKDAAAADLAVRRANGELENE